TSQAQSYSDIISKAHVQIGDLLTLAVFAYGQVAILSVLALSFSVATYRKLNACQERDSRTSCAEDIFWAFGFLAFSLWALIFFFGYFLVGFERIERYSMMFATILAGRGLIRMSYSRP